MSLLDDAKNSGVRKRGNYSEDELVLAMAYLKGEVTTTQVCHAIGKAAGKYNIYAWLAPRMKAGYQGVK